MSAAENEAIAQRLFDANNGTLDELPEVVAPDVVDHNAVIFMQPEVPRGRGRHPYAPAGFPRPPLTTRELVAEGDKVVARFTMSGTNTGDYGGLPASTTGSSCPLVTPNLLAH